MVVYNRMPFCTSVILFLLILDYFTGTKVEGILRQSADVEEVDRRVQEYEQGFCACLYLSVFFFLNCF